MRSPTFSTIQSRTSLVFCSTQSQACHNISPTASSAVLEVGAFEVLARAPPAFASDAPVGRQCLARSVQLTKASNGRVQCLRESGALTISNGFFRIVSSPASDGCSHRYEPDDPKTFSGGTDDPRLEVEIVAF